MRSVSASTTAVPASKLPASKLSASKLSASVRCVGLALAFALASCGGDPAPRASSASPATLPQSDWRAAFTSRRALRALTGAASYYHDSLAGRSTASGEPYDPRAFTAANRTLPFGTVLRIVRVDTGASVIVRVNDRGPFGRRQRIVDLSRAAAEELDMIRRGVVQVRAEVLELGGR